MQLKRIGLGNRFYYKCRPGVLIGRVSRDPDILLVRWNGEQGNKKVSANAEVKPVVKVRG